MEGPVQDGVATAPSRTGKTKLEMSQEDLIKFAKKGTLLHRKSKSRAARKSWLVCCSPYWK
uniref:Uncharacterized protein n=1 Tax=Peromyscus maniculatus bairdii TaxID=230844 RepID=A0A8C8W4H5_PERMB